MKSPAVLDFLDLPDSEVLHESDLESAILSKLSQFLLELGKGFAFVARQKRLTFEDEEFYVDLVFYNIILKCYLLIDLSTIAARRRPRQPERSDHARKDGVIGMLTILPSYLSKDTFAWGPAHFARQRSPILFEPTRSYVPELREWSARPPRQSV